MLDTAIVPIRFSGGLDSKTDPKLVLPGKLTLLENGVFTQADKISKRNGYTALGRAIVGSSSSLTAGSSLSVLGNELGQLSGGRIYSYSPGFDSWIDKGAALSVGVGVSSIVRNSAQQSLPDMAILQGIAVYAWQDSRGGIRASVIEQATGSQIQSDVQLSSTGTTPRCVVSGGSIFVLYAETTTLKARRLTPSNPSSFDAAASLQTDLNASPQIDAAHHGTKAVVVYRTGTSQTKAFFLTQDGTVGTTTLGLPNPVSTAEDSANSLACVVEPTTSNIFVLYHNGTAGLKYFVLAQDFTTLLAPHVIDATTSPTVPRVTAYPISSSQLQVIYEVNATNTYDHLLKTVTVTTAGSVGSITVLKRSVGLASKAFSVSGSVYVLSVFDSTLQATYFALKTDGTIVAKLLQGQAGGLPAASALASVASLSTTQIEIPVQIKTKFVSEGNTTFTVKGVSQSTIEFGSVPFMSRALGDAVHFGGGFLSMYDGAGVVEHGFHLFPENGSYTPASTGGSIAAGAYQYTAVFEWMDARGQLHRSSPGVPVSVSVPGATAGSTVISISTLRLTAKTGGRANVSIAIYRTKASGTLFYRLTSITSPLFNDTTADTVSYTDTAADSSIGANEILYTSGNVLENIAAPACQALDVYDNRMVLIPSEDPNSFWYSKQKVRGEGVAFSDSFVTQVNPLGGDLAAPKMMDDKIVLFKNSHIFYVAGEGPNDTGSGDNFSEPALVTSDVGCTEPASLVLMPLGIMFKSAKGIYLLSRSLETKYIGAEVEAFNSQSITSAELVEDKNQVRFLTGSGSTLVYDYFFDKWSTFTNHAGVDAAIWNGNYVYLRSDGKVMQESPTHFLDDNLEFRLRIGTAWIKTAGVQGYQRVKRAAVLGEYKSAHILRVKIGYDYDSTFAENVLFNAGSVLNQNYFGQDAYFGQSSVYGGVADNTYQFRAHLKRQKCEAIRFLFEDVTAGTPGEGYSLSELSLEVGVKRGLAKLRAQKSVG